MKQPFFSKIELLYAELPPVNCRGCGGCCVSPTCTLAEFIVVMDHAIKTLGYETLISAMTAQPVMHKKSEGNIECPFLINARCTVHPSRPGACRLFGLPAISSLGITDLDNCPHIPAAELSGGDSAPIATWLDRLIDVNTGLYPCMSEPFYVKGLNLQSWCDLYFEKTLTYDVFADIKRIITESIDLSPLQPHMKFHTNIGEKIDKISILNAAVGFSDAKFLGDLLLSIRGDYPFAGTYFYEESGAMIEEIERFEKGQGNPQ